MTDDVMHGPVRLRPGDNEKMDVRAWEALEQLGDDCGDFMLMHYEPNGKVYGRIVAAFKHRGTRLYRRVSFGFTDRDPATRAPDWESVRDYLSHKAYTAECESHGIESSGLREGLAQLQSRAERLTKGGAR